MLVRLLFWGCVDAMDALAAMGAMFWDYWRKRSGALAETKRGFFDFFFLCVMGEQFTAAAKGDLHRVKQLVTEANVDDLSDEGQSALHLACMWGHTDVAVWLVSKGARLELPNVNTLTPLFCAAYYHGHAECVRVLLDAGAHERDGRNNTALHWAADRGHVACVALLIAARPHSIAIFNDEHQLPLHMAARTGGTECCRLLLDAGSDIQAVDMFNLSPLGWAICGGEQDTAKYLLDRGARLEQHMLQEMSMDVPKWAWEYLAGCKVCTAACWSVLQLQKAGSRIVGPNGRDVLRLVSRCVLATRRCELWAATLVAE